MTRSVEQQKAEDLAVIVNSAGIDGLSDEQFKARWGQTIAEAKAPGFDTVYVQGGRVWGATRAIDVVDFDVEGSDPDDLCNEADCAEENESHYHYSEG